MWGQPWGQGFYYDYLAIFLFHVNTIHITIQWKQFNYLKVFLSAGFILCYMNGLVSKKTTPDCYISRCSFPKSFDHILRMTFHCKRFLAWIFDKIQLASWTPSNKTFSSGLEIDLFCSVSKGMIFLFFHSDMSLQFFQYTFTPLITKFT